MEEETKNIVNKLKENDRVVEVSISEDSFRVSAHLEFDSVPSEEEVQEVEDTITEKVDKIWDTNGIKHNDDGYVMHFKK